MFSRRVRAVKFGFLLVFLIGATIGVRALFAKRVDVPDPSVSQSAPIASVMTTTSSPLPEPTFEPKPTIELPVLMYHYIQTADPNDKLGYDLSVAPGDFRAQLSYLKDNGFMTITPGDLEKAWQGKIELPTKSILLTFDDGYSDLYTNAFPILREFNMKATAYIVTGFVGQPNYVTWEQVLEMDQSGLVTIGSHTISHADLTKTPKLTLELTESRRILEEKVGHSVLSFCYPAGRLNDAVIAGVRDAGYTTAVTTKAGTTMQRSASLTLPRVRIHGGTSLARFVSQIN